MQKIQSRFGLFVGVLALCGGVAVGQTARFEGKIDPGLLDREFDPDSGTESPLDASAESYDGEVAGIAENCDTIGAFTTSFTFPDRYRGNLYRITDAGVFLKEIKMQLAFADQADLFVSVHRKLPNNSYVEVDINPSSPTQGFVFIDGAEGLGLNVPSYYSSGLLNGEVGIELPPGDYAIGYAWGPESVKYGRDTGVAYPRPISVGSTLASVSRELSGNEPPLPANLASLTLFTGGAYAMQLCFVPVEGACCLSAGTESRCANLLEVDCVGEGSYFHGQRTTCKDTICEFGACCFACDSPAQNFAARCGDNYVTESCDLAGGINFWTEVSCPGDESVLCPKLVGACCNGTTCSLKCETECLAGGGTYEGDGTNCDPNTHVCKGACCVTGGCFDRTEAGCAGSNGDFHGRGTRCFSESCGGACCYGFTGLDFCEVFSDRALCAYDPEGFPNIAYRGDGTICPRTDPPFNEDCGLLSQYKACCLPDGTCINTTSAVCNATWIQGAFNPAGTCATVGDCVVGRCCYGNGDCEVITTKACTDRVGTYGGNGATCLAGVCNSIAGACCQAAIGTCTMKSSSQCNAEGGFYRGDNTDCTTPATTCPGFGACCRGNGECLDDQTQSQCSVLGGAYGGAGSECATQNCDQRGACCAVTGSCLQTTSGTCAGIEGDFKGVGVQCAPGVCFSGACCLPDEGCKKRTPVACASDGGEYRGNNVACGLQTCTIQGACCSVEGCTIGTPDDCLANEGSYLGDDTTCITEACQLGSCCRIAGTCEDEVERGGCVGPGEAFNAGTACSGVQCTPQGACCNGATCTVTTQAGCTGTYQGNGVECAFDTCAATGACCNGTACTVVTQVACGSGGGTYKGDNVACGANTCPAPTGACCTGSTCTVVSQAACVSGGGTYKGDNVVCGVNTCPAPTGACCNGTSCSTATQAACTSGGGTYKGDGVVCGANTCQAGTGCTVISGMTPANCSIDARRPHPPNAPGTLEGAAFVDLTFDCDTTTHTVGNYEVRVVATGTPPSGPTIVSVAPNGTSIRLNLSGPIAPGAWTCFKYTPANLEKCIGFLPADTNSGGTSAPADILDIVDHLNNVRVPLLLNHQCDIDRSGICAPADLLTEIDLLNGTNGFINWNGKNLPTCPSP